MNRSGGHNPLEVLVLGPVALRVEGDPLQLERPLERALAVRLALARGAAIADERLARDLWGDTDLARPAERLRVLASRLRRSLGDHAAALRRSPAGFALDAVPADLVLVEELSNRLHVALRANDVAAAHEAAVAALGQWRGVALADLRQVPFGAAHAERLDAFQLDLQVERLDTEVAIGGIDVRAELERLTSANPLHERLCCLYAISLYRAGRQADALDRIARLRKDLADELGVDPAPATSELELKLLRQDPSLAEPEQVRPTVPRIQLPAAGGFVGRDGEHATLVERLSAPGLTTLLGGPGVGKTRLATEVARTIQNDGRPVAWLDLSPVSSPEAVVPALVAAVGIEAVQPGQLMSPADPFPRCVEALRDTLLVVDNAEHLIDGVAELVSALCRRSEGITVLVTSQRPLRLTDEELHQVGALPRDAAIELFCRRSGAQPGPDAEIICIAVDRLPLGIELAAGLTRTLSVRQLAARIDDRLRLLVGGPRDAGPRHTSLRAALDWSYDLLDDDSRAILRRLAAFAGGCTLDAAEQVLAGDGIDPTDVPVILGDLIDRCLVTVRTTTGEPRFGLLETVRDYAAERLSAAGEEQRVRRRQAEWCVRLVAPLEEYGGADHLALVGLLGAEEPNIRAAMNWCLGPDGDALLVLDIVAPSWWFWWTQGLMNDARGWLRRSLELSDSEPTPARARGLKAIASLTRNSGDPAEARVLGEEALAAYRALEDQPGITGALLGLSVTALAQGDFESSLCFTEEIRLSGDSTSAERPVGAALNNSGLALRNLGRPEEAETRFRAAREVFIRIDDHRSLATAATNLAFMARLSGRLDEARELALDGLARFTDLGLTEGQLDILDCLAITEVAEGNHETGLRLLALAGWQRSLLGAPLFVADEIAARDAALEEARHVVGRRAPEVIAEAQTLSLSAVVAEVLATRTSVSETGAS